MKTYRDKIKLIKEDIFDNLPQAPLECFQRVNIQGPIVIEDEQTPRYQLKWLRFASGFVLTLASLLIIIVSSISLLPRDDNPEAVIGLDMEKIDFIPYSTLTVLFYNNRHLFNDENMVIDEENAQFIHYYLSTFSFFFEDVTVDNTQALESFNYGLTMKSASADNYLFSFNNDYYRNLDTQFTVRATYKEEAFNISGFKLDINNQKILEIKIQIDEDNYISISSNLEQPSTYKYQIFKDNSLFSAANIYYNNLNNSLYLEKTKTDGTLITYIVKKSYNKYNINYFQTSDSFINKEDLNEFQGAPIGPFMIGSMIVEVNEEGFSYSVYMDSNLMYNQIVPLQ